MQLHIIPVLLIKIEILHAYVSVYVRVYVHYPGCLGVSDSNELLSDDWQHLDVDAIELVKAAPGTRLSQTAKECPHHLSTQMQYTVRLAANWTLNPPNA